MTTLLNPTYEEASEPLALAPPLRTLRGATIGLLDNNKKNAGHFLHYVAELLREEQGAAEVKRFRKSNATAPAPAETMAELVACDAVVTAIGDCGSCSSCTLHDAITAEAAGTPAVGVMTESFVPAARLMAEMHGIPTYGFAVIGHPFSSDGEAQLRGKAAATVRQAVELLTQAR